MENILVAYVTRSGSTRQLAEYIGKELGTPGTQVDVLPISQVSDLTRYELVVVGGLLYRFGWHPDVVRFLQAHEPALKQTRVALFVSGLRLVKTQELDRNPFPVFVDPAMAREPAHPNKLTLVENLSTYSRYLGPALPSIAEIHPVSLAFFAGNLDLKTLNVPERLIMGLLMLTTGVKRGDHRNWGAVRTWAGSLRGAVATSSGPSSG
jgi:menaquinone-dependent protoporphyrinogen oxidase